MELGCGLRFGIEVRVGNEKEGERTANRVDRAQQAGSGYRKELDFVHIGLLLFPWFSSFKLRGIKVEDHAINISTCYTLSDGKNNNNNNEENKASDINSHVSWLAVNKIRSFEISDLQQCQAAYKHFVRSFRSFLFSGIIIVHLFSFCVVFVACVSTSNLPVCVALRSEIGK